MLWSIRFPICWLVNQLPSASLTGAWKMVISDMILTCKSSINGKKYLLPNTKHPKQWNLGGWFHISDHRIWNVENHVIPLLNVDFPIMSFKRRMGWFSWIFNTLSPRDGIPFALYHRLRTSLVSRTVEDRFCLFFVAKGPGVPDRKQIWGGPRFLGWPGYYVCIIYIYLYYLFSFWVSWLMSDM